MVIVRLYISARDENTNNTPAPNLNPEPYGDEVFPGRQGHRLEPGPYLLFTENLLGNLSGVEHAGLHWLG